MANRVRPLILLLIVATILTACVAPEGGIRLPPMQLQLLETPPSQFDIMPTPTHALIPPPTVSASASSLPIQIPTTIPTDTSLPYPLWIAASVPDALRDLAMKWNLPAAESASTASLRLGIAAPSDANLSTWIYALVAPFPTTTDGVTLDEIKAAWSASSSGPFDGSPLWMTESTLAAFTAQWGQAAPGAVKTVPADQLVDTLWQNRPAWGIVPFEALEPKLKVLSVDGQSPIHNDFDANSYPLKISFALVGGVPDAFNLPALNRDPEKLTVLLMTGVTALVRATAYRMEIVEIKYPAWNIAETLQSADITHISNEIPFYSACPPPDPQQEGLVFCSSPKYIQLLEYVGTDVVELTGNHFMDYGADATLNTLAMYNERQWPYYGGGANLEDSQKPAIIEHHGNRFAFIGCNPVGPQFAWATEDHPGAAPCGDYKWIKDEIARLKAEGYIVIATFQYLEYYQHKPTEQHMKDFRAIADAGATIVDGSQAHLPQAMEFYDNAFIHYGLGNLFFDQMAAATRREFLDRDVFYDGRYISTELLTAMLEDYARPRLMEPDVRDAFLKMMFEVSGW